MRTLFRTSVVALALLLGTAFAAEARDWGSRSRRDCDRPSYSRGSFGGSSWNGAPGRSPWGPPGLRKWSSHEHRHGYDYRRPSSYGRYSGWNDRWDRRSGRDRVVILERRAPGYTARRHYHPRGW